MSKQKYRELRAGELIRDGDEVLRHMERGPDQWRKTVLPPGYKLSDELLSRYRRPIPKPKEPRT